MNMPLWFSNPLFWSVQVALLVLVAGFLPRLFQIRQAQVLLAYWRALLLITLVLPFVQPWHRLPSISPMMVSSNADTIRFPTPSATAVTHWHSANMRVIAEGIGLVVLGGIVLRFALLVLGLLRLRRFREVSTPITDDVASAAILNQMVATVGTSAEFRLSAHIDSPVMFGFKPVILLPKNFLAMDARFQSAIACHELLHVRRLDWAQHLVEEIFRAVFWFHPAIAWLISRMRLTREQVVDLEVIRLTNARKAYLEALLVFTAGQTRIAAIPAPPFLAERQLVERISLVLKEVRMSRGKLVASLGVISCCLAVVVGLSAWSFPLKRAPRQSVSKTGGAVAGGVSDGVAAGVSGGVTGGVNDGIAARLSSEVGRAGRTGEFSEVPDVDYSTIWIDTVKRGPMLRQVRGLGKLVRAKGSANVVAQVTLPTFLTADVKLGENASIASQQGPLANGHVSSIGPSPSNDTRSVDIALDAVPDGARAGLEIDATIDIEKLENVLSVARPAHAPANSTVSLFKIVNDGKEAVRVKVKLGRSSVYVIEVLDGLQAGDKVILSDMSSIGNADRIHLIGEYKQPSSR
jgi:beta-lactamase regulating signal transducer with metallopeptidase domain